MASTKLKIGDEVVVISGGSKGKTGKIAKILHKEDRAIVEKLNLVKRHVKKRREGGAGQIIEMEAPIHLSNLMMLDPTNKKRSRVGYKVEKDKKVRIAKKSGKTL